MVCVWYASGIGYHWRAIPRVLNVEERRQTLGEPFVPSQVGIDIREVLKRSRIQHVREVQLRRAGSRLVYEVHGTGGLADVVDADTGKSLSPIADSFAREIAKTLVPNTPVLTSVRMERPDSLSYNLPKPFYRVTFDDAGHTHVYVSAATASILARAHTKQRLYFWFVSIPHHLTFDAAFFQPHESVRYGALFLLNALGALIVASGGCLIASMLWRSGFMGGIRKREFLIRKWHYVLALIFSLSTLLFIGSGFFLVVGGGPPPEGVLVSPAELQHVLPPMSVDPSGLVELRDAWLAHQGETQQVVTLVALKKVLDVPMYAFQDGSGGQHAIRADTGQAFAVDRHWMERVAETFLARPVTMGEVQYLTQYDSYYYARNDRFPPLPVYRVVCDDPDQSVLYLSTATGEVIGRTTHWFRVRRWLVHGLHAWDFPFLLNRPLLRNTVVLVLTLGGLLVSLTGLYLGTVASIAWWKR
jgi:hypothetical protein